MSSDQDIERVENAEQTATKVGDSVVAEANAGKSALVEEQKADTDRLKAGGSTGTTGEFGKVELVGNIASDVIGIPELPDLLPDLDDFPSLPELPDDFLPDLDDIDLPDVLPDLPDIPDGIIPDLPDFPDVLPDLPELPNPADLIPDLPSPSDLIPELPDIFPEDETEEKPEGKTEESEAPEGPTKVLKPEDFDQLGEDVAKQLKEMGVQEIEITELGDSKKIKMKLEDKHQIETGREDVKAVAFDESVEFEVKETEGSTKVENIKGVAAVVSTKAVSDSLPGDTIDVTPDSIELTTGEDGVHRATVDVGIPFVEDRVVEVPDPVHDRLKNILTALK